jgi:hypothetical protein
MQSQLLGFLQTPALTFQEELGASFHGIDASQVANWLESLGYNVQHHMATKEPV